MTDVLKIIATILAIIASLALLVFLVSLPNRYTCHRYGRITGREVRVAFPGACYVHTDKGWFTVNQVRSND